VFFPTGCMDGGSLNVIFDNHFGSRLSQWYAGYQAGLSDKRMPCLIHHTIILLPAYSVLDMFTRAIRSEIPSQR
jgi:hypothetical protein